MLNYRWSTGIKPILCRLRNSRLRLWCSRRRIGANLIEGRLRIFMRIFTQQFDNEANTDIPYRWAEG